MINQPDFNTFLACLAENKVRYMIVGGHAVAHYGFPRFTKDLDVFYSDETSNILLLRNALIAFGFKDRDFDQGMFDAGNIIKIGVEPVRIDLLNQIDGVQFNSAIKQAVQVDLGNTMAIFIGLDDLLINKSSTGRLQDRLDLEKLRQIRASKE